jgi:hypothetical protein
MIRLSTLLTVVITGVLYSSNSSAASAWPYSCDPGWGVDDAHVCTDQFPVDSPQMTSSQAEEKYDACLNDIPAPPCASDFASPKRDEASVVDPVLEQDPESTPAQESSVLPNIGPSVSQVDDNVE